MLSFCKKETQTKKEAQYIAMYPKYLVQVGCNMTMSACSKRG